MIIFKKIGSFFKTIFGGAYMWITIYFSFFAIFLSIGLFFAIAKYGNGWHFLLLVALVAFFIYLWRKSRK